MPPEASITKEFVSWAEGIEQQSNGRVKITCYLGGSLLKHGEMYRGVQDGIADIAWYSPTEDPGNWDLNSFQDLAMLGFKSDRQATKIYDTLLKDNATGLMQEFYDKNFIPYGVLFPPTFQLWTTSKAVNVPDDIKGMKIYAVGTMAELFSAGGGAPVTLDIGDVYMSLDRGLIQAVNTHPAAMMVYNLLGFIKYATWFGDGGCYAFMNCFLFNKNKWDSLPSDIQTIFKEAEAVHIEAAIAASHSEMDAALAICKQNNVQFTNLTQDEIAVWQTLAEPSHEKWLQSMESKGKGTQAKALWAELQNLIAEYPSK